MGDVTNIWSFAKDCLGGDSMTSGLFAKTDPERASPLYRGAQVQLDLIGSGPLGELRESETSYREFVEHYAPSILKVAYTVLGNHAIAEEVARDAFVSAWFFAKDRSTGSSHFARVYKIVLKECFRRLTAKRSFDESAIDRSHARRDVLNKALARIADEDRCLLLLRELEDYSVTQLSELTGLDEFAVKNRLFITRRRLARDLRCQVKE
jgi:RNA polymerase sigma factor (sigma-70 family)